MNHTKFSLSRKLVFFPFSILCLVFSALYLAPVALALQKSSFSIEASTPQGEEAKKNTSKSQKKEGKSPVKSKDDASKVQILPPVQQQKIEKETKKEPQELLTSPASNEVRQPSLNRKEEAQTKSNSLDEASLKIDEKEAPFFDSLEGAQETVSSSEILLNAPLEERAILASFFNYPKNRGFTQAGGILSEFYREALGIDAQTRAARIAIEATKKSHQASWGNYLPQLSADITFSKDKSACDSKEGDCVGRGSQGLTGSLSLTQVIYNQALINSISSSSQAEAVARFNYQARANTLLSSLLNYLLSLSIYESQIKSLTALSESLKRQELIIKAKIYSGQATKQDLYRIQNRIYSNEYKLEQEKILRRTLLSELDRLSGKRFPRSLIPSLMPWDVALYALIDTKKPWISWVLQGDPAYLASLASATESEESYHAAFASHIPTLSAFGTYTKNNFKVNPEPKGVPDFDKKDHDLMVGLRLSIPIFSGFSTQAKADAAEASFRVKLAQAKATYDILRINSKANLDKIQAGGYQLHSLSRALEAAKIDYQTSEHRYGAGLETLNNLLDAQAQYFASLQLYHNALKDFVISQVTLQLSSGRFGVKSWNKLASVLRLTSSTFETQSNEYETQ